METQDEDISANADVVENTEVQPSLDDTLRSTLAGLNEQEVESNEARAERLRDERGRFASAQGEVEPAAPQAEVIAPAPEQPATQDDRIPSSLSGAVKNQWGALPPEIRNEFVKRENDFHKGIQQYKQAAEFGSQIYKSIQPYVQTMQSLGVSPVQAIPALFQADDVLRNGNAQQKREMIGKLIQQYQVSFTDEPQQAQQFDPNQIFQQIPGIVDQTISKRIEYMEVERAKQDVETFAKASDKFGLMNDLVYRPDGSSYSPFRQLMYSALEAGIATDLKSAYEIAARAHPKAFELQQAEQRATEEAKRKQAAEDAAKQRVLKVSQARQASSTNVRSRGVPPQVQVSGSMEDTLRSKLREIQG